MHDTTLDLGLGVKAFREARYGCSSLGCRVRVDLLGRDYELEVSEILLLVRTLELGCKRPGEISEISVRM